MKVKLTINTPQTAIAGWTGFITLPNGQRVSVIDYCGGAPCSFPTREKLIAAMTRRAKALVNAAPKSEAA